MNIREGMKRLAILLGACGGIVGGCLAYSAALELWKTYTAHRRFSTVMASPTMRQVAQAVPQTDWFDKNAPIGAQPPTAVADVNAGGVKQITVDKRSKEILSVQLANGESLEATPAPHAREYAYVLLLPVLGFLVPWVAVRVLAWVGVGFLEPRP